MSNHIYFRSNAIQLNVDGALYDAPLVRARHVNPVSVTAVTAKDVTIPLAMTSCAITTGTFLNGFGKVTLPNPPALLFAR